MTGPAGSRLGVPHELVSWHRRFFGETGRAWIDALPDLADTGPWMAHADALFGVALQWVAQLAGCPSVRTAAHARAAGGGQRAKRRTSVSTRSAWCWGE